MATPTSYNATLHELLKTDPKTCKPVNQDMDAVQLAMLQALRDRAGKEAWQRVTFTLLSMLVSASIMAAFNVSSFYTGVSVVVGSAARKLLINYTFASWQYETTHPDAIIKLIEAIYMKRHEVDLVGEEELYRMLQELIRQPELLKSLTGSSLKGALSPHYDKLSQKDRDKLEHLDKLERKGFDVDKLREELLAKVHGGDDLNM